MASQPLQQLLHHVRKMSGSEDAGDAELLRRYVRNRDETAFELLLWRHERLVLGVCRRMLNNSADIDDVFQAVFLTLVRCAGSIRKKQSLASWLYKVTYRIALRANADAARRSTHEKQILDKVDIEAENQMPEAQELRPLLDREIQGLPEKYRLPVVLCYLQGRNYEEAARVIGCPKGTVSSRLTKARELLHARLTRRGITLRAGALAAYLSAQTAMAQTSHAGIAATVKLIGQVVAGAPNQVAPARAMQLSEGVIKTMYVRRLIIAGVFLFVLLLTAGASALTWRAWAVQPVQRPLQQNAQAKDERPPAPKQVSDMQRMQGMWKVVLFEHDGQKFKREDTLRIADNLMLTKIGDFEVGVDFRLDASQKPKTIDLFTITNTEINGVKGKRTDIIGLGIYELKGDTLKICMAERNKQRPRDFKTAPKSGLTLRILQRTKPALAKEPKFPIPDFVSAEVRLQTKQKLKVTDAADVKKLASFFPGVGTGLKSPIAASWGGASTIMFKRKNGKTARMAFNPDFTQWSEGKGVWKVKPGLREFINKLIRNGKNNRQSRLSKPQNHDPRFLLPPQTVAEFHHPARFSGRAARQQAFAGWAFQTVRQRGRGCRGA